MERIIVALSGKQLSGKDMVGKILVEDYGYTRISVGDMIKKQYSEETGLTIEEINKDKHIHRKKLIDIGKNEKIKNGNDCYIKRIFKYINENNLNKVVITDMRTAAEFNYVVRNGGLPVRINSDINIRKERGKIVEENDPTETELDNVPVWFSVIENNGTVDQLKIVIKRKVPIFEWPYKGKYGLKELK